MYLIICYDIVSNRRRSRLFRRMKDYLPRVQKSVFEGEMPDSRFGSLLEMIRKQMDQEVDTVRIYHLCKRCITNITWLGVGPVPNDEWNDIII